MIRSSFVNGGDREGGGGDGSDVGSPEGPAAVEDEREEKEPGFLLGAEKDGSGSVIGFHLIHPSGIFIFVGLILRFLILLSFEFWNL